MDILSNISDNINIGSNNVMEVAKYASGLKCGGLLEYTHTKGILKNNMRKNFNSGSRYRSSITCSFPAYKDCLPENRRNFTDGREVGDLYGIDGLETSASHKFLTKKEFLEMNDCILKEMTKNNQGYRENLRNEQYLEAVSYLEKKEALNEGNRVTFNYSPNSGTNVTFGLDDWADIEFTNQTYTLNFLHNSNRWDRLIKEYGSLKANVNKFENLSRKDISDKIYESIPQFKSGSGARLFFGNAQTKVGTLKWESTPWDTEKVTLPSIGHYNGLYKFYSQYRDVYKTSLPNIIYPKDGGKWTINNQYGVTNKKDEWDFYSFGKNDVTYGNVSIKADYKEDYRTKNLNNNRQYRYYNEGNVYDLTNANISDGTSVALDGDGQVLKSPLLEKTNKLFKELKIGSLINRFHTGTQDINDELMHGADSEYGLSRGRNLFNAKRSDRTQTGFANPYCRTWTAHHQYSLLKHGIRPLKDDNGQTLGIRNIQNSMGGLRPSNGGGRLADNTVLRDNGLVKITPTREDFVKGESIDLKRYMFSIENLAWRDVTNSLSAAQRGDHGGRIMWFPPYNLRFSENVNVSWNAQSFIGRGEEMYTYSNTIRSGTLDFTLLIDHPSLINQWRGAHSLSGEEKKIREETLLRFFAGEGLLGANYETGTEITNDDKNYLSDINLKNDGQSKMIEYVIFFPHNFSGKNMITQENGFDNFKEYMTLYNSGKNITPDGHVDKNLEPPAFSYNGAGYDTRTYYEENCLDDNKKDKYTIKYFSDFTNIANEFGGETIFGINRNNVDKVVCYVTGYESDKESVKEAPYNIANNRAQTIKKYLSKLVAEMDTNKIKIAYPIRYESTDGDFHDYGSEQSKLSRMAKVVIGIKWKETGVEKTEEDDVKTPTDNVKMEESIVSTVAQESIYTYSNEYLYFSELENENKVVHKYIVDKIRHFDPAFHSITPEGFNARLTFLHQCTRQGPTTAVSSGEINVESGDFLKFAGNLAFGRAPYCILRIGDFFHTKICIDSISIQYDNSGVQWDMNPEGIGLQPMFANISVSFKFLGGQDISGPIERLQNAVTSNFYANASVYNDHADNGTHYYDAVRNSMLKKE